MEIIKKIDQYIKGSIPEEQLDSFTKNVVKEHFEKEALQLKWKSILEEENNFSATSIENSQRKSSVKNPYRFLKIGLSVAASVLVLLLAWFVFPSTSSSSAYEQLLIADLDKPYIESITRKGSIDEIKLLATASYNNRDYTTAQKYFDQLSNIDQAIDWDFYIGLCQLYNKESDSAIQSFKTVLEHPQKNYKIEANWYLALSYLINENFEMTKKHLEMVIEKSTNDNAWKVKDAKDLLDALP